MQTLCMKWNTFRLCMIFESQKTWNITFFFEFSSFSSQDWGLQHFFPRNFKSSQVLCGVRGVLILISVWWAWGPYFGVGLFLSSPPFSTCGKYGGKPGGGAKARGKTWLKKKLEKLEKLKKTKKKTRKIRCFVPKSEFFSILGAHHSTWRH